MFTLLPFVLDPISKFKSFWIRAYVVLSSLSLRLIAVPFRRYGDTLSHGKTRKRGSPGWDQIPPPSEKGSVFEFDGLYLRSQALYCTRCSFAPSPPSLLIHTTLCLAPSPRRLVYSSCQQVCIAVFFSVASAAYPHGSIHFVCFLNRLLSAAYPRKCQFIVCSLSLSLSTLFVACF